MYKRGHPRNSEGEQQAGSCPGRRLELPGPRSLEKEPHGAGAQASAEGRQPTENMPRGRS